MCVSRGPDLISLRAEISPGQRLSLSTQPSIFTPLTQTYLSSCATQNNTNPHPNQLQTPRNQTQELTSSVRTLFGDVVVETSSGRSYLQTLKSVEEVRETHAFQHISLAQPALAGEA